MASTTHPHIPAVYVRNVGVELWDAAVQLTRTRSTYVRLYEACPRKWLLQHLAGYPADSDAMAWGRELHAVLEAYYKHGTLPNKRTPHGKAALKSLPHLPPPGPTLRVEESWATSIPAEHGDITYTGAMDLYRAEPRYNPDTQEYYLELWDHKSCAQAAGRYAKTARDLEDDLSANAYAHHLLAQFPQASYVKCRWVYTQRDARQSVPVDFIITRNMAQARWDRTLASVRDMCVLLTTHSGEPMQAAPNYDHCSAFGGCPYRSQCGTAADTVAAPQQRATLPIMSSKLMAKLQAAPAAAVDPINPPDAAPHNTPEPAAENPAAAYLREARAALNEAQAALNRLQQHFGM